MKAFDTQTKIYCKDCKHLSTGVTPITDIKYYCLHPDNMVMVATFLETKRKCKVMADKKNWDNKCGDFTKNESIPDFKPVKMFY